MYVSNDHREARRQSFIFDTICFKYDPQNFVKMMHSVLGCLYKGEISPDTMMKCNKFQG